MKDGSQQSLNRVGYLSKVNDYLSSHYMLDENDTLTFWKEKKERYPTLSYGALKTDQQLKLVLV